MIDHFDQSSAKLSELFIKRSKKFYRASFFVKFMLLVVASAIVSIMQFLQIPDDAKLTVAQAIGIASSVLVFAGASFTLLTEEDSSIELAAAREATEAVRDVIDGYWDYEDAAARAIQLYQTSIVLRSVVERAGITENATTQKVIETFMDVSDLSLPSAMGFELA